MDDYDFSSSFLRTNQNAAMVNAATALVNYAHVIDHLTDEITEMRIALRKKDEELKAKDAEIKNIIFNAERRIGHADQQVIMMRKRLENEINAQNNDKGEQENV